MAMHLTSSQGGDEIRKGMSYTLSPHHFASRMGIEGSSAESFSAEFRRDRANVRPYVRSSSQKLKWTQELHQCFMNAVKRLGGQNKATPKKIQQQMNKEGITIAHIKSHLQMYRGGRINTDGMPKSDFHVMSGRQWPVNNDLQDCLAIDQVPTQPSSTLEEISGNSDFEPAVALIQLKTGRNLDCTGVTTELSWGTLGHHSFQGHSGETSGGRMQLDHITMSAISDEIPQHRENCEQESCRHTLGETPHYRSRQSFEPVLSDNCEDTTNSLRTRKRNAKGIDFNFTVPTGPLRPRFRLPSPSSKEEASLNLALSFLM